MTSLSDAELQATRLQGYDEARTLGSTAIDVEAIEREIAKRDASKPRS